MEETQSGVNENGGSQSPVEDSPTSQTTDNTQVESNQGQQDSVESSAETLNTGNTQSHVPYERFKEVNEQARQYKKAHEAFEVLEALAAQSPEFAAEFQATVEKHTTKRQQPQTQKAKPESSQSPEISSLMEEVQMMKVERNVDRYVEDYEALAKDIPAQLRAAFDERVAITLRENGGINRYDQNLLKSAFNETRNLYKGVIEVLTPKQQPKAGNIPSQVTGPGAVKTPNFMNDREVVQFIANGLRAAN
jgi:hypothetical protein